MSEAEVATYIEEAGSKYNGVGPSSSWLMMYPGDTLNTSPTKSDFINACHAAFLAVHPWTLRDDYLVWTP